MTQFDPLDEKLKDTQIELREAVTELELILKLSENEIRTTSPTHTTAYIEDAQQSDGLNLQPWMRRRKPGGSYAGFWVRLGAHSVDLFIVSVLLVIIHIVLSAAGFIDSHTYAHTLFGDDLLEKVSMFWLFGYACPVLSLVLYAVIFMVNNFVMSIIWEAGAVPLPEHVALVLALFPLLIDSTYHALMESSPKQATLGKRLFHIHVTDTNRKRLSLWQAYVRYFAKIWSSLTLCAGYIAIIVAKNKQGFHDKIARTYVLDDYDPALLPSKTVPGTDDSPQTPC